MKKLLLLIICGLLISQGYSQDDNSTLGSRLQTDTMFQVQYATDLEELIANFILSGVTVSNITFTGHPHALGSFNFGNSTNLGMDEGIIISSGNIQDAVGPNNSPNTSTGFNTPGDPDLNIIASPYSTGDAGVLSFDVIPEGNMMVFNYVFSSEEYHEFVNTDYNDVFGFFFTGQNPYGEDYNSTNIAIIPGTQLPVAINNVNNGWTNNGPCENCQFFVDNTGGQTLEYDAFTTVIPIQVYVVPGETYHLKMAIADCSDYSYDSGIFLECPSLKSYTVTGLPAPINDDDLSVYPSPVNSSSVLSYKINKQEQVSIKVYNMAGVEIETLVNSSQSAGNHSVSLSSLSQKGVYIIRVTTGTTSKNVKVVVD